MSVVSGSTKIVVIGLGYVGLPLAVALARHFEVWGLDINAERVADLKAGRDRTGEIDSDTLAASSLRFTTEPGACPPAEIYIVTVPTPIDGANKPDLRPLVGASETVAGMIRADMKPIVVFESTVYPGVTEDICRPLMARISGLTPGEDFFVGYSPERINPGDRLHTVDRITKVISGETPEITAVLADVYGRVTTGGVFAARSIKVAEAAKVIENAQRDINIAFMNEITQIFRSLDLSVWDVLAAARTKWNFLPFEPGLVGGHCIGVDPYYLSHRAQELGHDAQVILSGRAINDSMADWVAEQVHGLRGGRPGSVLVLGLTFKENVPDLRNSKVADLIASLKRRGHAVTVVDPLAEVAEARHEYGIELAQDALTGRYDCVLGAVPHDDYRAFDQATLDGLLSEDGVLVDLKRLWPQLAADEARLSAGKTYWSL